MVKRVLGLLLLAAVLAGCGASPEAETVMAVQTQPAVPTEITEPAALPTTVPAEPERFTLTFVGDCTFGANPTNYHAGFGFIKTVGEDYGYPFRNVLDYVSTDEATFVNLEGPLCDGGNPAEKAHTFRGPTAFVDILTECSVEFVTLANNHAMDYGQRGYDSTLAVLESAGIPYVERDSTCILTTANGLRVGIYGAVYYRLDVEDMTRALEELDRQCDLVIYAPHWGSEKRYQLTQEQESVGHQAIDAGADIVWGSHPHVLQKAEEYGGGLILYSMGNFSFGGNGMPEDFDTAMVQVEVVRHPDGTVVLGERKIIPCCISSIPERNNYQPTPYAPESEGYERVLEKLAGTYQPYR